MQVLRQGPIAAAAAAGAGHKGVLSAVLLGGAAVSGGSGAVAAAATGRPMRAGLAAGMCTDMACACVLCRLLVCVREHVQCRCVLQAHPLSIAEADACARLVPTCLL